MSPTAPVLDPALARARAEWLAGDPAAWSRYTACLAHLEAHARAVGHDTRPPAPPRRDRTPLSRPRARD